MIKALAALALILVSLPVTSVAQTGSPAVASAQQKVVLTYFHDVLDGGKVELLDNLFHTDCAVHRPEGDFKGVAGLRSIVQGRHVSFSKFATEVHDIFESGDRVVVRLTHRVTGSGVYRFSTGTHDLKDKSLTWDAIVIFRMQGGKIAEEWVSRDELGMLLSAGILKRAGIER